jgi:hypothetical protein
MRYLGHALAAADALERPVVEGVPAGPEGGEPVAGVGAVAGAQGGGLGGEPGDEAVQVGVSVESITGLDGRPPPGPVQVKLRDVGTGDSQVVMVGLRLDAGAAGQRAVASVELRYQDQFARRGESVTKAVVADAGRVAGYDPAWDVEVLRNVTIQAEAEGLREIDRLYKAGRYQDAWRLAQRLEADLRRVGRLASDDQLVQDAATMRRYEDTLARAVERQSGRPSVAEPVPTAQPPRGREPPATVEIR